MKSSKGESTRRAVRSRRALRRFAPLAETLEGRQLLATTWYVNAAAAATGADGTQAHPFPAIQLAVDAAGAGDTVSIAAGTYAESVRVTKPLTLDGPNAGIDPNTGTRAAEAVIVPPATGAAGLVQVLASNVTVDGLSLDGQNTSQRGVSNLDSSTGELAAIAGMTVQNDIIQNTRLFGVLGDSPENPAGSPTFFFVSTGNTVAHNLITNVPTLPSSPTDTVNVGRGVSLEDDFYGSVTDNVISGVAQGVQAIASINSPGVVDASDNAIPFQIANNTISATDAGININLQDAGVSTYTINNNQLTRASGADAWNTGIRLAHVLGTDKVTLTGNNISGFQTGIELDYVAATPAVTVTGGTISNVGIGVLMDNDNPPSDDVPPKATQAALVGVTITGASSAGIVVRDDLSNNVTASPGFTAPVVLTTDAQTTVTNGTEGVKLLMPPASQYNAAGVATAILHDTGTPTVTLTQTPAASTTQTSATFLYTTADNLTTPGDMVVRYQLDNQAPAGASAGTVALSGLSVGSHTLVLRATDQGGNAGSTSYQWTVTQAQTAAPTLALAPGSDTGASSTDGLTNDKTPTFRGTAPAGSTVNVYAGTSLLGTVTADGSGSWRYTVGGSGSAQGVTTLADGAYSITATATAGNVTSSPSAALALTVDTAAPTVTLTSEPAVSTTQTTATFTYNATDNVTPAGSLLVQYRLDGGSLTTASGGTISLANLSLGVHTLTIQETDQAGNTGGSSYRWSVGQAQTAAPTLGLAASSDTGVSNADGITNDNTPTFQGTAPAGSTVSVYAVGTPSPSPLAPPPPVLLGTTIAAADGSWSFTVGSGGPAPSKLADGAYTITATAQAAGATVSQPSSPLSIVIDSRPPTVHLTRSVPATDGWNNTPVTFTYSASAAVQGVGLVSPATGSFTFSSEGANQSHVFTVTDVAGNTASVSTGPVNIDLTAPTRVTASAALADPKPHGNNFDINVSGVIVDALSGAGKSMYSIFDSQGDLVAMGTFMPRPDGTYSFKLTIHTNRGRNQDPSGDYTIVVGGADKAGNVTLATTTITLSLDDRPGQGGGNGHGHGHGHD